jgi:MoaA/NifB/PqqE/SkfB family radical SAM enzyme
MDNNDYIMLREEWFGGFEYCWRNNHIAELNNIEYKQRISSITEMDVIIQPEYGHYVPSPIRLNLDLTYRCNRYCRYCHSDSGPNRRTNQDLTTKEVCAILSNCKRMGIFEVTLTGGEPLLKPGIWEILEYVGSLKTIYSNLITNGTLITPTIANRLAECKVSKVNISLDGFEYANDYHRWDGAYDEALRALKILLYAGCNIGVISVITNKNIMEFERFVNMLFDIGVRKHNVSTLCDIGRAQKYWMGISYPDFVSLSKKMELLKQNMAKRGYTLTFNDSLLMLGKRPNNLPIYSFNDAVPGWKCTVKANGDVFYDRVWGRIINLGNVRQKNLYDIWQDSESDRAECISQIFQSQRRKTMLDLYARLDDEDEKSWDWISSLDKYYRENT